MRYVRLLCRKAHKKTKNARFSLNELPHYARAIVAIALHPTALYSHHQAGELNHVGEAMKKELRDQAAINRTVQDPLPCGSMPQRRKQCWLHYTTSRRRTVMARKCLALSCTRR